MPRHRRTGWRARRGSEARTQSASVRGVRRSDAAPTHEHAALSGRAPVGCAARGHLCLSRLGEVAPGEGYSRASRLARLADDVDEGGRTAFDDLERSLQSGGQPSRVADRSFAPYAVRAGKAGEVDRRLVDDV